MEIYVGNIPPTIKIEELSLLYQSFGHIVFIDIKNRCQPPFAFILFDNNGSAYNAAVSTNGCMYQGYQFQVKLLTPDDNSSATSDKCLEQQQDNPPKKKKETVKKITIPKNISIPENGKPGGLDDPFRNGLSGAGVKWYLRYLKMGTDPKEARIKACMHKFIALGDSTQIARKKAIKYCSTLDSSNKKIQISKKEKGVSKKPAISRNLVSVV
ncbi:zinc finger CCHC-type and RNA-binding motif-containing protein 1-like [Lucilia sericata]|uniref:zinc finger CCHC-type and RNA-binding motif-containing protein 1-like n=1 Tax=Lucilia sericata TaxID=13632 RepID=UPI0018A87F37|nr:zinc finger CCHC-type and RNA-binding motif-containing protein 1-like [Lucilia sericata]